MIALKDSESRKDLKFFFQQNVILALLDADSDNHTDSFALRQKFLVEEGRNLVSFPSHIKQRESTDASTIHHATSLLLFKNGY